MIQQKCLISFLAFDQNNSKLKKKNPTNMYSGTFVEFFVKYTKLTFTHISGIV